MSNKSILISSETQEKRIAIVEDGVLQEFFVERPDDVSQLVGSVYKGRVSSVVPGIGAAFIDIGLPKNGFLYVSDIVEESVFGEDAVLEEGNQQSKPQEHHRQHRQHKRIDELVKNGQEVLVQVVKEPLGTKGARLTTHVSLPGRYMVLMPTDSRVGVSKRIGDDAERARLRQILSDVRTDTSVGMIVRTVGVGQDKKEFARDLRYLMHLWQKIKRNSLHMKAPSVVYEEYDVILRIVRDTLTADVDRVVVDRKEEYKRLAHFISILTPGLRNRLSLYQGELPLFAHEGVDKAIAQIYERKVMLPSGGYLLVEPTEGLVAIDVNSGKFTGRHNLEETAFQVNKEAAIEIARQLRLRDMGGIIVIDFIDVERPSHRREVYRTLEEALKRDRAKTNLVSFSELCVVEMTRQRMRRSVESVSHQVCPYCEGRGSVQSPATVGIQALRQLRQFLQEHPAKRDVEVCVHPDIAAHLLKEDRASLSGLERRYRSRVIVMSDPALHQESVRIQPA